AATSFVRVFSSFGRRSDLYRNIRVRPSMTFEERKQAAEKRDQAHKLTTDTGKLHVVYAGTVMLKEVVAQFKKEQWSAANREVMFENPSSSSPYPSYAAAASLKRHASASIGQSPPHKASSRPLP